MHVRISSFEGDPARLDEVVAFARDEVAPVVDGLDGSRGMGVSIDRASGRCMVSSLWETAEAMRDSDAELAPKRQRGAEIMGSDVTVEELEVAVVHEVAPVAAGCGLRVTRIAFDPSDAETAVDTVRTTVIPAAELLDGFCRLTMGLDRAAGRATVITAFRDPAAVAASRDRVEQIRTVSIEKAHARVQSVREYELVHSTLDLGTEG